MFHFFSTQIRGAVSVEIVWSLKDVCCTFFLRSEFVLHQRVLIAMTVQQTCFSLRKTVPFMSFQFFSLTAITHNHWHPSEEFETRMILTSKSSLSSTNRFLTYTAPLGGRLGLQVSQLKEDSILLLLLMYITRTLQQYLVQIDNVAVTYHAACQSLWIVSSVAVTYVRADLLGLQEITCTRTHKINVFNY